MPDRYLLEAGTDGYLLEDGSGVLLLEGGANRRRRVLLLDEDEMIYARQSTAIIVTVGPVLDATGVAVTDGVVADFKASKNGGAPAALDASATLTHRVTGHYSLSLTATDVNTVGTVEIVIDDTVNACPIKTLQVIEPVIYDALFADAANAFAGAAGSTTLGAGAITATVIATGAIDADAIADNAIDAGAIAAGAIDAATFAADVDAEILSYIVDDATRIDASALNTAAVTSIPAILEDTGTTLQAEVDGIQADTEDIQARLPAALTVDGNIKADTLRIGGTLQTANDVGADVNEILTDTGTTLQAELDAIQAKTDNLPSDPADASVIAGRFDTLDTSVADLPTNAELATALGTADDAVLAAIAALNNLSQANVRTAVGLGSANLDTQLGDLPTNAELATALGTADDATLAAIAALNNLSAAQVNAEVLDVLNVDTLVSGKTIAAALKYIGASAAGVVSGAGTVTEVFADFVGTTALTITVDASGNRSAVLYG